MFSLYNRIPQHSIRIIIAIVALVSMSACSSLRPNARLFNQAPTSAPATYQQGWKDGCESGMALSGNQLYKAVYRNKIDPKLVSDTQYYRGWNESKVYCAHYTMAVQWESGTLPKTPTEEKTPVQETQGVFAVMASWGNPNPFNLQGEASQDEGYTSFGGIFYQ